ncbi:MAG: DUF4926 domain-containing protein [Spirochaetaceae bacterium]
MKEHDRVVLTNDLPDHSLEAGDVGSIVHVYTEESAYEVEFVALDGQTIAVVTIGADKLRDVRRNEVTHARPIAVD